MDYKNKKLYLNTLIKHALNYLFVDNDKGIEFVYLFF